ncbi:MAG TPA: hypothetical protein VMC04_00810, partial [Verrucomicrobiae bacterium]|jgi:hypothetical protein|nr:hypothetical protein [Verrucomicrobiae bacterium]
VSGADRVTGCNQSAIGVALAAVAQRRITRERDGPTDVDIAARGDAEEEELSRRVRESKKLRVRARESAA